MIKENELRIGNLVGYDGRVFEIDTIAKEFPTLNTIEFGIGVVDWMNVNPIPLTEEWLLKFGFIKHVNQSIWYTLNKVDVWFFDGKYVNDIDVEIKYVNQLQNLYWCLTGEELKLDHNEVR
jgi:hypothetical protein